MKKNNSNMFPLLTGMLVGGAAIYFLKSDKGQKMVDLALKNGETIKEKIVDNSKEIIESSQKAIDKAIESSKESLSDLAEGAKQVASNKLNDLDYGINKAKNKIAKASK